MECHSLIKGSWKKKSANLKFLSTAFHCFIFPLPNPAKESTLQYVAEIGVVTNQSEYSRLEACFRTSEKSSSPQIKDLNFGGPACYWNIPKGFGTMLAYITIFEVFYLIIARFVT